MFENQNKADEKSVLFFGGKSNGMVFDIEFGFGDGLDFGN